MQERCGLCGFFGYMGPNLYSVGETGGDEKVRFCLDSAACKRRAYDRIQKLQLSLEIYRRATMKLIEYGQVKELTPSVSPTKKES